MTTSFSYPKLIGLYSSVPGSGKTTISDYLHYELGYKIVPFAADLKDMVAVFLHKIGIAEPFTYIQSSKEIDLKENIFNDNIDQEILDELGSITPRYLCQTLGTEWGRELIHSNVWILLWKFKVKTLMQEKRCICVDDCRFVNEFDSIKQLGGQIWNVSRPDHKVNSSIISHASEGNLDAHSFDVYIKNDGSITDLYKQVDRAINSFNLIYF
jgi:hypothetical protein